MSESGPDSKAPLWITEPFRIFFPLGIVASLFAALIWPLFYAGWYPYAPHLPHPRIMIFGFGFAFVTGFLGTAWPHILDARPFRTVELGLLVTAWLTAQILYAFHHLQLGDSCFFLFALLLLVILASRIRRERDLPPPGFSLAFLSVIIGAVIALTWALNPGATLRQEWEFRLTKLLASQGLLLLPVLGVGSYLFPRFFARGDSPFQDSIDPRISPFGRTYGVWISALLVVASLFVEAFGWVRLGNGIRFAAVIFWLQMCLPMFWKTRCPGTRAVGLKWGVGTIAATFLTRTIWPGPGYAFEHLLLLGGFGLIMLLIGDRVSLAHNENMPSAPPKSHLWRWLIGIIIVAAATRASADFKASITVSHHIYAALLWTIVLLVWGTVHFVILPRKN